MPGRLKVKVRSARNLPIMDPTNETTDAYVEIHFGETLYKTEVFCKSLNPFWNTDFFTFETEDQDLQENFLMLRVMDHDTYSANDPIGRVYIDVNTLLCAAYSNPCEQNDRCESIKRPQSIDELASHDSQIQVQNDLHSDASSDMGMTLGATSNQWHTHSIHNAELNGFFPIIDTQSGQCGELEISVHLELLPDTNIMRESSCGILCYTTSELPPPMYLAEIHGLVDVLIASGDPEYAWIDKIRSPRATNEARLETLRKIVNELKRKIGRRAMSIGANAILGLAINYDFEQETTSHIVVRAIGTAVTIENQNDVNIDLRRKSLNVAPPPAMISQQIRSQSVGESEAILEALTHKTNQLYSNSQQRIWSGTRYMPAWLLLESIPAPISSLAQPAILPLLTLTSMPPNLVVATAGVVCARAVRLLNDIVDAKGDDGTESRINWWNDLRQEIILHMKSLACNAVIGYRERLCINGELVIAWAEGTAALLRADSDPSFATSNDARLLATFGDSMQAQGIAAAFCAADGACPNPITHAPYSHNSLPFPVTLQNCQLCKKGHVPDICIMTFFPNNDDGHLFACSTAHPIQSIVVRKLDNTDDEVDQAAEISNLLPFLEQQVHNSLLDSMRATALHNAIIDFKTYFAIHDKALVAVVSGVSVQLHSICESRSPRKHAIETPQCDDFVIMPLTETKDTTHQSKSHRIIDFARSPIRKGIGANWSFEGKHPIDKESPARTYCTPVGNPPDSVRLLNRRPSWSTATSMVEAVKRTLSKPDIAFTSLYNRGGDANHPMCRDAITLHMLRPSMLHDDNGREKYETKKGSKAINRFVNKLRRRQVDKEDFATALFLRNLTLNIGIVDETIHPTEAHTSTLQPSCPRYGIVITRCAQQFGVDLNNGPIVRSNMNLASTSDGEVSALPIVISHEPMPLARHVSFFDANFIRQTTTVKCTHDLDVLILQVMRDAVSVARAHVRAINANGLASLNFTTSVLDGSISKHQGIIIIGIQGDIVKI